MRTCDWANVQADVLPAMTTMHGAPLLSKALARLAADTHFWRQLPAGYRAPAVKGACSALRALVAADPAAAAFLLQPGGEAEWAPVAAALRAVAPGQQAALCVAAVTRALQRSRTQHSPAAGSREQQAAAAAAGAAALELLQVRRERKVSWRETVPLK